MGLEDLPMTVIPHPLGELTQEEARARGDAFAASIRAQFGRRGREVGGLAPAGPDASVGPVESWAEVNERFLERGWTDGLPVVPPTRGSVDTMLATVAASPSDVVGVVPPKMGLATAEVIAANAVMAGCTPQYFPVVFAAVRAMLDPAFNLLPMQATTNPVTPLILVNGPAARELRINAGTNVLGQGFRANATIGRALRLVLTNVGGGIPGVLDMATHGQPGKFAFCIAENEAASPWPAFHVDRGYAPDCSTVSVIGVTGTQDILHYARSCGAKVIDALVRAIPREGNKNLYSGGGPLLILGPEQAAILGREGYSKRDLAHILFERCAVPLTDFDPDTETLIRGRRREVLARQPEPVHVPIADTPDDILVVVAGGAGNHSVFLPSWGDTRCITMEL
jgi:hypothetical protein